MRSPDATDRLLAARERTTAEGSARVLRYSAADTSVPTASDLRGEGVVEFESRRAEVTDQWVTESMLRESDQRDSRLANRIKRAFATPSEFVFDGGRRYIRNEDGGWRSDDKAVAGPRHVQDPLWALDALAGANSDVSFVERAEVADAHATRWRLTIDLRRASEKLPAGLVMPDKPRRRWLRRPPDESWQRRVPAEVWLDEHGRIRRIAIAALAHAVKAGEHTLWFITEFSDFGVPTNITIPTQTRR